MFRIRLKQLREERGYSQFAFAKKLGVAQSTVGNWESGIREPSFETIQKISEALNTTPSHLMGWDTGLGDCIDTVLLFKALLSEKIDDSRLSLTL